MTISRADAVSSTQKKDVIYSDFTSDFDIHPDKNDLIQVTNEDAVAESIRNLLMTNRGERLMKPNVGSNIASLLFEPITPITQSVLQELVTNTITNYEKRAKLVRVVVSATPDMNSYTVTVVYSTINKADAITSTFILNRIR